MWNPQLLLQHYVYLHADLRLTVMKMDYISESVSKLHGNAFFYKHVKAFVMVSHHSNKQKTVMKTEAIIRNYWISEAI